MMEKIFLIIGFITVLAITEFITHQILFTIDRYREEKSSFRNINSINDKVFKTIKELNYKCDKINEQISNNTKKINSIIDKIDIIKDD